MIAAGKVRLSLDFVLSHHPELVQHGTVEGDALLISKEDFAKLSGKRFGLGDAVEILVRPVARLLGIRKCGGCKRRQASLNRLAPGVRLKA